MEKTTGHLMSAAPDSQNGLLERRSGNVHDSASKKETLESLSEINHLKDVVQSLKKTSLEIIRTSVQAAIKNLGKNTDSSANKAKPCVQSGCKRKIVEKLENQHSKRKREQARYKRNRIIENLEERRLLLKKQAKRKEDRRAKESLEERQLRRESQARRNRERRARETSEERRLRQKKQADDARYRRSRESEEQRNLRRQKSAQLIRERRAKRNKKGNIQTNKLPDAKIANTSVTVVQKGERKKNNDAKIQKSFCCEICGKQYKDSSYLKIHIKRVHSETCKIEKQSPVECEKCGKTLANKSNYRAHVLATHTDGRQFQCGICEKKFTCQSALHSHKVMYCEKEKAKKAPCPICGKILENYILLSYHKANAHQYGNKEENFCHLCKKTLSNSLSLYNHNKLHHQENINSDCSACQKTFRNRTLLFDHWRIHRSEKPFQCSLCLAKFQQRCSFYSHRKLTHKGLEGGAKVIVDQMTLKLLKSEFDMQNPTPPILQACNLVSKGPQSVVDVGGSWNPDTIADIEQLNGIFENNSNGTKANSAVENRDLNKTFLDFSRANVPENSTANRAPPEDLSPDLDFHASSENKLKLKKGKISELSTKISNAENEADSDEFFGDYYRAQGDSPLDFPLDDNFENVDIKDIEDIFISHKDLFFQTPTSEDAVVKLERLEKLTCLTCNIVFHSSLCYKKHLKSESHLLGEKNNSSGQKRMQVQYELSNDQKALNLENNYNCFTCEFCNKKYLQCFICKDKSRRIMKRNKSGRKSFVNRKNKNFPTKRKGTCDVCGKEVKNLKAHRKIHSGEKPYKCEQCPKSFISKYLRKCHIESDHLGQRHICDICGVAIKRLHQFKLHRELHGDNKEKRHYCEKCPNSFPSRSRLRFHLRSAHKIFEDAAIQEKLICPECGKQFPDNYALNTHIKRHSEVLPFPCNVCSLKFLSQEAYDKHFELHDSTRPFGCEFCSYFFTFSSHLQRHIQSNHQKEKHVCEICEKVFTRLDTLNKHRSKYHKETMVFKCDQCPNSFVSFGSLNHHVDSVHREKKYICQFCSNEFPDRSSLLEHKKIHGKITGRNPFPCSICTQRFRNPKSRDKHLGIHDSNRPFACDSCPSYFNFHSNLTLHKKNVHQKLGIVYKTKKAD